MAPESEDSDTDEESGGVEQRPSRQREYEAQSDEFGTGYDSDAATRVGIGTAEGKSRKLVLHNEGRHPADGNHSTREAARDKTRIVQTFCSRLDVTPHQYKEASHVIRRLNLDRFGSQKRLEKVALCVIRFVVDQDRQRLFTDRRDPSEVDFAKLDLENLPKKFADNPQFLNLCDEHEVSSKDRYSISQLIKRELKAQGYFEGRV